MTLRAAFIAAFAGFTLTSLVWVKRAPAPVATSEQQSSASPGLASAGSSSDIRPSDRPVQPGETFGPLRAKTSSHKSGASLRAELGARTDGGAQGVNVVRLMPSQVLATVNDEPIQLRHLTPVGTDTEKELTREQYDSRLKRAVEMELMFQAARAEGVGLTAAQQKRVDGVGPRHQAEMDYYRQYGLTWSTAGTEQVDFEKRVLTAQMLEQNLLARKSAVAPSPDSGSQARYEQARSQLINQLRSQANIDGL